MRTSLALALALVAAAPPAAQPAANSDAAHDGAAPAGTACGAADPARGATARPDVAAYLRQAFDRRGLPAAAAIVIHDGRPSFVNFGRGADGRPVSEDTPVYIGSMSKAFTAAAVLQLAERGLVVLDAPVTRYVPEFRVADGRGARITVRQLLNQTSGLSVATDREWRLPQPHDLSQAVLRLKDAGLATDPGSRFAYHNPNYAVLARLVEKVSGQPFPAYLREHIFAPLGMPHTVALDRVRETEDGAAPGHVHAFGRYFPVSSPPFFISGAGGVLTTPRDYAQWLQTQLNDGQAPGQERVLTAASMRASHTPGPNAQEYGFGWNRRGDRVSHSGGLPNHASYVAMDGCDAVAVFAPVAPAAAPLRELALEGIDALKLKAPRLPGAGDSLWLDSLLAVVSGAALLLACRDVWRSRRWASARRGQPSWRIALSFAPPLALLALVLLAIPWAVSRVMSWSWIWLWFYAPLRVAALASIAGAAALSLAARSIALAIPERPGRA